MKQILFFIIATLCLSCSKSNTNTDKTKEEREEQTHVYIDRLNILHIDRQCPKIAKIKGSAAVEFIRIEDLEKSLFRDYCGYCISDTDFEQLDSMITPASQNTLQSSLQCITLASQPPTRAKRNQIGSSVMNEKKAHELYNILSETFSDLGTYEEFKSGIQDPTRRLRLFNAASEEYSDLGTFDEFNAKLGFTGE